jgi:hypothetical protein
MHLVFIRVLICVPTSVGMLLGLPSRALILGKAMLPLGGHLVSQGVLFETDSPTAIHPMGMTFTPYDLGLLLKVYSFRCAVFCMTGSPLVGYGSSPHTDGLVWREAIFWVYHPWRIARALLRPPLSPLGNTMTPVRPSQLP